jgi:hypothetical protein
MGVYTQPLLLAIGALVYGVLGSAWITRHCRGARAAASYLLLTAVPYVAVMVIIAASTDRSLTPQQAQYNGAFAFALFVMAFTVPWIVACLVGRWLGRRRRVESPTPSARAAQPGASAGASTGDLPDWRHADNPRLTLVQLDAQIRAMAERHGFAPQRLPECRTPREGEGAFIDVDKFDYIYGQYERGQLSSAHPSAIADEICYRVLYDLAFADAMNLRSKNPDPALPYLGQVHRELDAILRRIDPRWAAQAVHERALRAVANA